MVEGRVGGGVCRGVVLLFLGVVVMVFLVLWGGAGGGGEKSGGESGKVCWAVVEVRGGGLRAGWVRMVEVIFLWEVGVFLGRVGRLRARGGSCVRVVRACRVMMSVLVVGPLLSGTLMFSCFCLSRRAR